MHASEYCILNLVNEVAQKRKDREGYGSQALLRSLQPAVNLWPVWIVLVSASIHSYAPMHSVSMLWHVLAGKTASQECACN